MKKGGASASTFPLFLLLLLADKFFYNHSYEIRNLLFSKLCQGNKCKPNEYIIYGKNDQQFFIFLCGKHLIVLGLGELYVIVTTTILKIQWVISIAW